MCRKLSKAEINASVATIDEMIAILSGSVEVIKAKPDITTPKGFDKWVASFTKRTLKAAGPADKRAIAAMLRGMSKPWATMSPASAEQAINQAVKKLSLNAAERVTMSKVVGSSMEEATRATLKTAGGQLNIETVYSAVDERVVRQVRNSQSHYIRDAYGRRQTALSGEARRIVAGGVRAGFDSATIGQMLSTRMTELSLIRAESYWTNVSSIYTARSRSYGLARSYTEAEIERIEFISVSDERTTEQCLMMDGQILDVSKIVKKFEDVAADPNPEAVVQAQPFMQLGRNKAGKEFIYFKRGDKRIVVADVLKPARGRKNAKGSYRIKLNEDQLSAFSPPLHGHCRSTTIPV